MPNALMRQFNILGQLVLQPSNSFAAHPSGDESNQHQDIAEAEHKPQQNESLVKLKIDAELTFLVRLKCRNEVAEPDGRQSDK